MYCVPSLSTVCRQVHGLASDRLSFDLGSILVVLVGQKSTKFVLGNPSIAKGSAEATRSGENETIRFRALGLAGSGHLHVPARVILRLSVRVILGEKPAWLEISTILYPSNGPHLLPSSWLDTQNIVTDCVTAKAHDNSVGSGAKSDTDFIES